MIIYRVARTEFCDVSGLGAKKYGGRWNHPGHAVLYGSSSVSSALLERLTIDPELFSAARHRLYSVMEIHCQSKDVFRPRVADLPAGWDEIPFSKVSQDYGTALIEKGVLCFAVPSVVDRTSLNLVLNPLAKGFVKLTRDTYPLQIDSRILQPH